MPSSSPTPATPPAPRWRFTAASPCPTPRPATTASSANSPCRPPSRPTTEPRKLLAGYLALPGTSLTGTPCVCASTSAFIQSRRARAACRQHLQNLIDLPGHGHNLLVLLLPNCDVDSMLSTNSGRALCRPDAGAVQAEWRSIRALAGDRALPARPAPGSATSAATCSTSFACLATADAPPTIRGAGNNGPVSTATASSFLNGPDRRRLDDHRRGPRGPLAVPDRPDPALRRLRHRRDRADPRRLRRPPSTRPDGCAIAPPADLNVLDTATSI
jgi:hypothetical protein